MTAAVLLDRSRIRRWCGATLAVQAALFVFMVLGTHGLLVPLHGAGTTDFVSFYAAGRIANGSDPAGAYDPAVHYAVEQAVTAPGIGYVHFFYPPVFTQSFITPVGTMLFGIPSIIHQVRLLAQNEAFPSPGC